VENRRVGRVLVTAVPPAVVLDHALAESPPAEASASAPSPDPARTEDAAS
jgi:hypothetical protein